MEFCSKLKHFIDENASKNIVCGMAAILSRGRWVNSQINWSSLYTRLALVRLTYLPLDKMMAKFQRITLSAISSIDNYSFHRWIYIYLPHKSHSSPVLYATMHHFFNNNVHMCAHFNYKMVNCGIFVWCTVGFVGWVCWNPTSLLGDRMIRCFTTHSM